MSDPTAEASHHEGEVRVLLVDDHAVCRAGICGMLADSEFRVGGEASSGEEALEAVRRQAPKLVLLEPRMAGKTGLDALEALKTEFPDLPVVILTIYDNHTYVARAVASGAAAYLLKGIERDQLLDSLRAVMRGEVLFGARDLLHSLRSIHTRLAEANDLLHPLTEREKEVVCLLATGLNNRDIGRVLFIAESTVKTHVEHIIYKLGVYDRLQVAVWAAWQGLIPRPIIRRPELRFAL